MRQISLIVALTAALALVATASSTSAPPVRPTLTGTCTQKNKLDRNGVLLSSTLTCTAAAACDCDGKTRLVYDSVWTSPGTGAPGPEKGTLTATGKDATVTLRLTGSRTGTGESSGNWVLVKVSGQPRSDFRPRGTYTMKTKTATAGIGPTSTVHVSATIACWSC